VVVIDNASTDGTADLLHGSGLLQDGRVQLHQLPTNVGGAGGFRKGLELALQSAAEWFWLMDDDTIAAPNALAELHNAYDRFPPAEKPRLLASKVEWTDGTVHPMNLPTIKRAQLEPERAVLAAQCATMSLRWASFVSVLISRNAVEEFGLPWGDYFIWNDDTEYTARMLRQGFGVLVPHSVVVHKTVHKHSPMDAAPERSYYQVRNVLWMILRGDAWRTDEKLKIAVVHVQWIARYLARGRFSAARLRAVARGLWHGLTTAPAQ
jgi:GT2 family glycosyltransferase